MMTIKLTRNKSALIDDEDFDKVNQFKWYCDKLGYARTDKSINKNKKSIYMHRFLLNCPTNMRVDHINHNTLDNRRINLRICTPSQNLQNAKVHPQNKLKVKGVSMKNDIYRKKPYIARIQLAGKQINLGYFKNIKEAKNAYNKAALKYFGEFAYID